jgi:ATP-dependent DNA helicase RecG
MLDRVQNKLPLEKKQYELLRRLGVVKGKVPNIYVSINVADIIDERPQYTKNRAMDNQYYEDLIIQYLRQFGSGRKSDFVELLSNKLSEVLDDKQKDKKVGKRCYLTLQNLY